MDKTITDILNVAVSAPSGDNCQPWKFVVRDNLIFLYDVPELDTSLYNWNSISSLLAHGAILENIQIAASHFGYSTEIEAVPFQSKDHLIAKIRLEKDDETPPNELYRAIRERVTNRKPFNQTPLSEMERLELLHACDGRDTSVVLAEDTLVLKKLGTAVSINEEILFSQKDLQNFFFSHISWTDEEHNKKRIGFPLKSLEIPEQAAPVFKLFGNWNVLRLLNIIHFPSLLAKANAKTYSSASAIGAILINGNSHKDFLDGGRAMQRIWLTATKLGLQFQPLMGIVLLAHRMRESGEISPLSNNHAAKIKKAYKVIEDVFQPNEKTFAFLFRVGKGGTPSGRTVRLAPNMHQKGEQETP